VLIPSVGEGISEELRLERSLGVVVTVLRVNVDKVVVAMTPGTMVEVERSERTLEAADWREEATEAALES